MTFKGEINNKMKGLYRSKCVFLSNYDKKQDVVTVAGLDRTTAMKESLQSPRCLNRSALSMRYY